MSNFLEITRKLEDDLYIINKNKTPTAYHFLHYTIGVYS